MFALAGRKMQLVIEAMSKGNSTDCTPFAGLISQYADFHEIRREKVFALSDILEEHTCDYEGTKEPTKFEYNGHVIYINKIEFNGGGWDDGGTHETSGLPWEYDDRILHYRVPSMKFGEVGYVNCGENGAEYLMIRLEGNHLCALCGYLINRVRTCREAVVDCQQLCRSCVCYDGVECQTCGVKCGKRRLAGMEHRMCKRRRTGFILPGWKPW